MNFKKILKKIFYKTGTVNVLDKLIYFFKKIQFYKPNQQFKNNNPAFVLPPDYYLYETYCLNYKQYKNDGAITAFEIIEWTKPYLKSALQIMEWGCGVSRVIRHMPTIVTENSQLFGADINKEMINWNKENIKVVQFVHINYLPPTSFPENKFDLIFAISVFTHIAAPDIENWIKEIWRIMADQGIFLFTTHGKKYFNQLDKAGKESILKAGAFTELFKQKGHRMMTTYNTEEYIKEKISPLFEVLEYYDGNSNIEKIGGQDLWIVRKKPIII